MASIRRTLSPYQQERYQNGGSTSPLSLDSHNNNSKHNTSSSTRFNTSFIGGAGADKHPRRPFAFHHRTWRRSIFSCALFFLLGFLLGLLAPAPFGAFQQDDDFHQQQQHLQQHSFSSFDLPTPTLEDPVPLLHNLQLTSLQLQTTTTTRDHLPPKQLIVVTPTYTRPLQAYYLHRLAHLLRLVPPPLLWIVVEMNAASPHTAQLLRGMGLMYRHLVCPANLTTIKDRGVHQRNTALDHIQRHHLDGIVYFADDDNVYSLQLFEAIRQISRFGTWPVAMLAQSKNKATLEGPVCNGSQVIGWHTNDKSKRLRRFHVDMSGFAFNSTILWDPKRWNKPTSALIRQLDTIKEGFQETTFIQQLVEDESQMEATPLGCSQIMNWHLHLEAHQLSYPKGWLLQKNLDAVLPIQ